MSGRGAIHNVEAYARGKMLDHSAWQRAEPTLPRNITPSDFDMVFDNSGWMLFCEISNRHDEWKRLAESARGQAMAYENAIRDTVHCAVLCKHFVALSEARAINTRADIQSFQVMLYDPRLPDLMATTEIFAGNLRWQRFVHHWFEAPKVVRASCIKSAARAAAPLSTAGEAIANGQQAEFVTGGAI